MILAWLSPFNVKSSYSQSTQNICITFIQMFDQRRRCVDGIQMLSFLLTGIILFEMYQYMSKCLAEKFPDNKLV